MTTPRYIIATERGLLFVAGEDRVGFLQGLVSNDVARVTAERSIYATLLTPQGKFLHDLFIAESGGGLLIDCESARLADLQKRLSMYRLRAKVTIGAPESVPAVALAFGDGVAARFGLPEEPGVTRRLGSGLAFVDPRLPRLGVRAILPTEEVAPALDGLGLTPGTYEAYDMMRVRAGVPDGSRDMPVDGAILLENGIDALNGVDWQKGCYMGQELTARTYYRGLIKRRLMPVSMEGPAPQPGTDVNLGDKPVGTMRSVVSGDGAASGLALIRLDAVEQAKESGTPLTAGDAILTPYKPDWANY